MRSRKNDWKKSVQKIIGLDDLPAICMGVIAFAMMISLIVSSYEMEPNTKDKLVQGTNNTTTTMVVTDTIPITTEVKESRSNVSKATSSQATTTTTDKTTSMTTTESTTTQTDTIITTGVIEIETEPVITTCVETTISEEPLQTEIVVDETEPIEDDIIIEPVPETEEVQTEPIPEETETPIEEIPEESTPVNTDRPIIYDCTLSDDLQQYIYDKCNEYGVEYQFIMAIIKTESGFNTGATNGSCVGLMQLNSYYNSGTASALGVDLWDPYGNVTVGIHHVADLLSRYSMSDALICYNYGEYGAQGYLGGSTNYSRTVMSRYYEYVG